MQPMKIVRILLSTMLGVLLLSGLAFADSGSYTSSYDIKINVELAPALIQTDGSTGEATFAIQESFHETLGSTTGQSVEHYYIWIYLNGKPVLAVDPFRSYDF